MEGKSKFAQQISYIKGNEMRNTEDTMKIINTDTNQHPTRDSNQESGKISRHTE